MCLFIYIANYIKLHTLSKAQTIVAIKFTPIISSTKIGTHSVYNSMEFGAGRQSSGGLVNIL